MVIFQGFNPSTFVGAAYEGAKKLVDSTIDQAEMDRLEQLILKLLSEVGDGTADGPNRLTNRWKHVCICIYICCMIVDV